MRIRKNNSLQNDISNEELESIAKVSDALAHPVRLDLFRYIMHCNQAMKKVCTKDLVEEYDYAQATISQHMKRLVQSGLIEVKKENKYSYYYVNLGILMQYIDNVKKYSIM